MNLEDIVQFYNNSHDRYNLKFNKIFCDTEISDNDQYFVGLCYLADLRKPYKYLSHSIIVKSGYASKSIFYQNLLYLKKHELIRKNDYIKQYKTQKETKKKSLSILFDTSGGMAGTFKLILYPITDSSWIDF